MTAPAARSRRTTSASRWAIGTYPPVPNRVGTPATSTSSLTAIGMPEQRKLFARRTFAVRLGRVGQCLLGQHHAERVERRLARVDGIKGSPYQFVGRYDAGGELIKLVGDRRKIGGVSGTASI